MGAGKYEVALEVGLRAVGRGSDTAAGRSKVRGSSSEFVLA